MSRDKRYDPEDLETLLSTKSFSELLPEEKAFALQYIDSDLEYDSMRETYSMLGTLPELEPEITPRAKTKEALLAAFTVEDDKVAAVNIPEETNKKGFWAWFWNAEKRLYAKPALQLASLVLVFMAGFFVLTNNSVTDLAENSTKSITTDQEEEHTDRINGDNTKLEIKKQRVKGKVANADKFKTTEPDHSEVADLTAKDVSVGSTDNMGYFDDANTIESEISNGLAETPVTINVADASENVAITEVLSDQINYTFDDASIPDLYITETIDANVDFIEEEISDEEDVASLTKDEKKLNEPSGLDSSLITLLGDEAIASDYRIHTGNAAVTPNYTISSVETAKAIDSPSAMFEEDEDKASELALTASDFSGLLGKLYTSE